MRKNDELIGNVSAIGSNMEGIVRIDNTVCFVPYALVGEKIKFKVLKTTKNIAFCKLLDVLTPAEERVRPACKVYEKCGGCQLQHLRYKDQLKLKTELVSDCIRKIAGLDIKVNQTVKCDDEYGYRNKLQLPVRYSNGNKIGFFAQNSHRIVEISECPIQKKWCSLVIDAFNNYIQKSGVSCYDEQSGRGVLRHVVVRDTDGNLTVTVVINGAELDSVQMLIDELKGKLHTFSLFINENTSSSNVILGDKFTLVYGKPYFESEDFGVKYKVVPQSFIQVNDYIKRKLYSDVVKSLNLDGSVSVIDAYSGAGLMTALIAKHAKFVYGIEIVKEAVESANLLMSENGISNACNVCAPCEEYLPNLIKDLKEKGDNAYVVLDPPRKGCDKKVLDAILSAKPEKIVYVSCSPQTLARDLGILCGTLYYDGNELKKSLEISGVYKITKVQPYDMFPQTKHVETLVSLEYK